ncbi:hypothetical protein V2J09_010000 [Rumex salicifolius]
MSSRSTNQTSSKTSSVRSRHNARVRTQTPVDAQLHVDFEKSERLFDYSSSADVNLLASASGVPSSTVSAYLRKIQRGGLVQPFGCLIAIDEQNFSILAYSENAPEMLEITHIAVPNIEQQDALPFGTDVRTLFKPSGIAALQKAANFPEVNLLNPILVHSKTSGKPFYAILHRIDVGLVIDLEPVNPADVPVTTAGALKSYKLAAKAISSLQAVPSGNILLLCDVLVREVMELTGYDRVMVYKFHEDEHGEVIAECHRDGLEPYLGLHYPATDIPQAARFLFTRNKVRMICDCSVPPVRVVQDKQLAQPLSLGGSTLRAPHGCHAQYMSNMGTMASLVMSVTINEDDEEEKSIQPKGRKLWGLVVCHHTTARHVPFPLRYACEFLVQVSSLQINKEVELAAQLNEKHILHTQTLLCDMLMRETPVSIITQSPNVMDLVRCDGAALYYKNKAWCLGVTPTEDQIKDLIQWLLEYHGGSTGLSTDSLMEAGCPGASQLGHSVCGMAAIRITSQDYLFCFRSHTAKEVKWGGAKHDPVDKDEERRMHPRSSFLAFLEVVKWRSQPWEEMEMDAIHSLQLILRGTLREENGSSSKALVDDSKTIVNVHAANDGMQSLSELHTVTSGMIRLIEMAAVPIFASDVSGNINGWNSKAVELTGLTLEQTIGLPLTSLVTDDTAELVKSMLSLALQGKEEKNVELRFKSFDSQGKNSPVTFIVNACCSRDVGGNIIGVCFIGQDITAQRTIMDEYVKIQGDYAAILRSPCTLIPPIFVMDDQGRCLEWNDTMQKLSGLHSEDAIGRLLLGEVFTAESFGCQVKDHDTLTSMGILFNKILAGENADKILFEFFDQDGKCIDTLLSASARMGNEGKATGVVCFLHVSSPELKYALQMQQLSEKAADDSLKSLSYLHLQIKNPLNGLMVTRGFMESSELSSVQNQFLQTRSLCEDQLAKIAEDTDVSRIEECSLELSLGNFNLGKAMDAVMSQVMTLSQENGVQIIYDSPPEICSMQLYGDHLRLQQVLSDFLVNSVNFSPVFEGSSVTFTVVPRKEAFGRKLQVVHLEFRITHPSPGIPEGLIQEMFHHSPEMSREGLSLYISQKVVKIMDGAVQYHRGEEHSSFVVLTEFPLLEETKLLGTG